MKLSCEIVKDLLPLYEEELCSIDSKKSVEEHLKQCKDCQTCYQRMHNHLEVENVHKMLMDQEEEKQQTEEKERKIIKKGLHKIRHRWILSIIAILMVFPLMGVGMLTYNQKQKNGICFSNINDIRIAKKFVKLLENGEYESAAKMQADTYRWRYGVISEKYEMYGKMKEEERGSYEKWYLQQHAKDASMSKEKFIEQEQKDFIEAMKAYEKAGSISGCNVSDVYYEGNDWVVEIKIREKLNDNDSQWVKTLILSVENDQSVSCTGYTNSDARYAAYEDKGIISAITMSGDYGPY